MDGTNTNFWLILGGVVGVLLILIGFFLQNRNRFENHERENPVESQNPVLQETKTDKTAMEYRQFVSHYMALLASMTPSDARPYAGHDARFWKDGFFARFSFLCPPPLSQNDSHSSPYEEAKKELVAFAEQLASHL